MLLFLCTTTLTSVVWAGGWWQSFPISLVRKATSFFDKGNGQTEVWMMFERRLWSWKRRRWYCFVYLEFCITVFRALIYLKPPCGLHPPPCSSWDTVNCFIRDFEWLQRAEHGHIYALADRESLFELCNMVFTDFWLWVLFTLKWNELKLANLFPQVQLHSVQQSTLAVLVVAF